jgi:hypothetical protein
MDAFSAIIEDQGKPKRHLMLALAFIVACFAVVLLVPRLRVFGGWPEHPLGYVSQEWLTKYRSSQQSRP